MKKPLLVLLLLCLLMGLISLIIIFVKVKSQDDELTLTGKLVRLNKQSACCGVVYLGAMAEYRNLKIIKGSYKYDRIYIIHGCTEMPQVKYLGSAENYKMLIIGDFHKLFVTRKNITNIEFVDQDEIDPGEYPVYYCQSVEMK